MRLRNFEFVLKNIINSCKNSNIVVYEQFSDNNNAENIIKKYKEIVNYKKIEVGKVFNKSVLLNKLVEDTKSKYIWSVDSDFFTNYREVEQIILEERWEIIQPYKKIVLLNDIETEICINENSINLTGVHETNNCLGKFSFVVSRKTFNSVGGFDENYIGWGFQDLDFFYNKIDLNNLSQKICNNYAVHLYHTPAKSNTYSENKKMYYAKKLDLI